MQRNWIGRSEGAHIDFPVDGLEQPLRVFTTRPDTVFGATFMVVAPEHPMVDAMVRASWPDGVDARWTGGAATPRGAVDEYLARTAYESDLERQTEREKSGVFTGSYAVNPATGARIPVLVADYVLMGYGTGAIMGVPGQDERDWEFAEQYGLPIVRTVQPPDDFEGEAYTGEGPAVNSGFLDGLGVVDAKRAITRWLVDGGHGEATVTYKLRDWLFSRQRYWGEPFPVVYDADELPRAIPESMLPVALPELSDFRPQTLDPDDSASEPVPPLGRVPGWAEVELDLGDGMRTYRRELNVMP